MNERKKDLYSVVVPVFNGEKCVVELYQRMEKTFQQMKKEFEVIFVDDYSKDHSFELLCRLHLEHDNVKVIQLARNFGQHKAILCGMHYISGDFVVTIDDDLQHPPEEIAKLADALEKYPDMDVMIGTYDEKKHNMIRNAGTWLTNICTSYIFKKSKNLKLTSFRLMRRYVADSLIKADTIAPRIGTMILQTSSNIMNVKIHHDKRMYGRSGYSFHQLVRDFFNNIIANSDLPLRMVGWLGMISCMGSFGMMIYYAVRYFIRGVSVEGWTTLIVLVLFLSGLVLFSLGIMGNYMLLILKEVKNMPLYVIRDIRL